MEPENNLAENTPKKGVFNRMGAGIKKTAANLKERTEQSVQLFNGDMQSSLLAMILPHVKKMIPKMEGNLKSYLTGSPTDYGNGDGKNKVILMKVRNDGKVEITIFDAAGIEINVTEQFLNNPSEVILGKYNVDQYVHSFLQGNFDIAAKDSDIV